MKKLCVMLCISVMIVGMTGCGKSNNNESSQNSQSSIAASENTPVPENSTASENGNNAENTIPNEQDYSTGWTSEMSAIKAAVVDALGDNYWPTQALDPDMLESVFGITPDMYDDYLAEMPMISTNVDTLVIVKAKEGQADTVEEVLNAYRDTLINDTMQYPMNVGKIQASRVGRAGDYVCFIQLGGDTMEAAEKGDEAVITRCQEVNDMVIEIIGQQVQ